MKTRISGFTLAALATAACLLSPAFAADPRDARRTLFVPVGVEKIVLEAPQTMCFLDQTQPQEGLLFRQMAEESLAEGKNVLLAVFAPCYAIAGIGSTGSLEILKSMGTVTWGNPLIGERTPLERTDYLDMREDGYKDHIKSSMGAWFESYGATDPEKYRIENRIRRNDNSVSLGFISDVEINYERFKGVGVAATTTLRNFPIEVMIRTTEKHEMSLDRLHGAMDEFLAQQIALNE